MSLRLKRSQKMLTGNIFPYSKPLVEDLRQGSRLNEDNWPRQPVATKVSSPSMSYQSRFTARLRKRIRERLAAREGTDVLFSILLSGCEGDNFQSRNL